MPDINGLRIHVLEAGFDAAGRPCVLLLHGFPELAYSWRKVMLPLAAAGFHVVAPDQRGYGRTTGWDADYDGDLASFRLLNAVRDALGLVSALGHRSVAAVVGHDFGSPVAAWCALVRPDVFRSVALMSAPFAGPPALPFDTANAAPPAESGATTSTRRWRSWTARASITNGITRPARPTPTCAHCPQGVHDFLRAYYHHKSADWHGNKPFPLKSWTAEELAKMPTYYIMDLRRGHGRDGGAGDAVRRRDRRLPMAARERARASTAPNIDRTGFQGGLQWYRCRHRGLDNAELQLFSGRTIDVPSIFIAGSSDWGIYQSPGASSACSRAPARGCSAAT